MGRPTATQPTAVELNILEVIWKNGASSLGEIHKAISEVREVAYSSTRKIVQVMCEKKLLNIDDSARPRLYSAKTSQQETRSEMVDELASKIFDGSAKKLVMSLVDDEKLSRDELQELRKLIRKAERAQS